MDKKIDSNILRTERRVRWIKRGVIVAVAVMAVSAGLWMIGTSVNRRDLFIATVDNGPLEITVPASGRVVPAYEEIVNSPVTTRILRVYAQPGDTVKAGTPLLQLDLEQEETALNKLMDSRVIGQQERDQLRINNRT
ncbi:MAG: HlyD family secretion protein, partial [Muribaculaceae bacterium]|nr:HlyD family secretion protein [Muribaculaceae bacterium]